MKNVQTGVLFGMDYYPEHWDRDLWESDAERMAAMGIRAVRLMENAWAVIEPREGRFDFSIFDEVIEIFARHDIDIVLGTPTATFPDWLYRKDPEMMQIHPSGIRKQFGTRREACFNNPTYLAACDRMVKAVARHFGNNPHVIGWQIDNELGHEGTDRCVCPTCQQAWHRWLKDKYKSLSALNQEWGTVFWSSLFSSFDSIPVPVKQIQTTLNPGLKLDYDRFCSEAEVSFVSRQVRILRKHIQPSQWLTHNVFLTPHSAVIDMENVFRALNIPSGSCYPVWGSADEPAPYYFMSYFLSYVRGLKKTGKFTILEQFTSVQGHDGLGYLPPKDQVVLWTNQSIARGANQVFYFRWRTAPFGQEQLCYGILNRDNKDTLIKSKLTENISGHQNGFARFANEPVKSEACLLYDKDNSRIVKEQNLSSGFVNSPAEYMQVGYDVELTKHFAPYVIFNINADVKSVQSVELEKYKILSLPVYQMTDPKFVEGLEKWVSSGGTLLLSWRTGTRDQKNWATPQELPGLFTNLAGIKIHDFESLNLTKVGIRLKGSPLSLKGEVWADILEPISAESLVWYKDRRKAYSGSPCITVNSFGKGTVYYVGTSLGSMGIFFLYRRIFKRAGLHPEFLGLGVEAVLRQTSDGKSVQVILNHNPVARWVKGKRIPAFGMRIIDFPD